MKRVVIVHGWDGHPEEGWFPWLKKELEAKGFEVFVPQLPDAGSPRIDKWVATLSETVSIPDGNTYFVGHSIGCSAIVHYLETLPDDVKIGGAVFVAGFFKKLTGLEDDADTQETARLWLTAPLDLGKVKARLTKSIAIFSDNDPYVPLDNQNDFQNGLSAEIIVEHAQAHFNAGAGFTTLPIALESVLKIST